MAPDHVNLSDEKEAAKFDLGTTEVVRGLDFFTTNLVSTLESSSGSE